MNAWQRSLLVTFLSGLLFALGLGISGMTQPAKVVRFLDITHDWDPSLALVMGGAIGVHALAYRLVPRLKAPFLGAHFQIPSRRDIDLPLLLGAALFGLGWGIGGFCPGPALTSLASGAPAAFTFVLAMLAGMLLFEGYLRLTARPQ